VSLRTSQGMLEAVNRPEERPLVTFLLAHLVTSLPVGVRETRRWRELRLLGAHLVGDLPEMRSWAVAADRVLSMQRLARVHGASLQSFYTEAREGNERTSQPLRDHTLAILDWVTGLDANTASGLRRDAHWVRLLCLTSLVRARATSSPPRSARDFLKEWQLLNRKSGLTFDFTSEAVPGFTRRQERR